MKRIFLISFLNIVYLLAVSQEQKSYAVIVGISEYEEIRTLEYAHKDAIEFEKFLTSNNGGNIPKENITLLLNKEATYTAIYTALRELLRRVEKNDRVYIYFSGHGDLENELVSKKGFLLAANTPQKPYTMNAVSIEDLNDIVNTLSATNQAQVILITDACHAGTIIRKNYNGTQLAAAQLRTIRHKEIRISSCGPKELSLENEAWGGGRSVFSYYLLKGLNGAAEQNKDNNITLQEIKSFIQESFAKDEILVSKKHAQNPILIGNENFILNKIVNKEVPQTDPVLVTASMGSLSKSASSYFFDAVSVFDLETVFDYTVLDSVQHGLIPDYAIDMLLKSISTTKKKIAFDQIRALELKAVLKENAFLARQFKNKLAQLFSDKGQEAINAYLKGDANELEKRRYYTLFKKNYAAFPKMFSVALKLIKDEGKTTNPLEKILEIKKYYFAGIVERLQFPTTSNIKPYLEKAIEYQQKALAINEDAEFVLNELGILYLYQKDYAKSEKYLTRATEMSPDWALPWANLAALNMELKRTDTGLAIVEKAIALHPSNQSSYVVQGLLYEQKNLLLSATEMYQKSIKLNTRYYTPFERLGYIYLKTNELLLADTFLYEAEERKKGNNFPGVKPFVESPSIRFTYQVPCNIDSSKIAKDDILSFLVLGLDNLIKTKTAEPNYANAEKWLKKAIALDKTNHLGYHYLGKSLFFQKKFQEAEVNFKLSVQYFLADKVYHAKLDSILNKRPSPYAECFKRRIMESLYAKEGDYFALADTYIRWGHFESAEAELKKAIKHNPLQLASYYKLWKIQEHQGKYIDAESTILSFKMNDTTHYLAEHYLSEFYLRMVARLPENDDGWVYKAGCFFYDKILSSGNAYDYDKRIFSREDNEFQKLTSKKEETDSRDLIPNMVFTSIDQNNEAFYIAYNMGEKDSTTHEVPGTREIIYGPPDQIRPFTFGLPILQNAERLVQEDENAVADINNKIGDLLAWQERYEEALPYYEKALNFKRDNANIRMKYIGNLNFAFNYREALAELDSLQNLQQINIPYGLNRAKFLMLNTRFKESENTIQYLTYFLHDTAMQILNLKSTLFFITNDYRKAITLFQARLNKTPKDPLIMYAIAHLFAKDNNRKKALEWLQRSIENGFQLSYVLHYDPAWANYKANEKWIAITQQLKPLIYKKSRE